MKFLGRVRTRSTGGDLFLFTHLTVEVSVFLFIYAQHTQAYSSEGLQDSTCVAGLARTHGKTAEGLRRIGKLLPSGVYYPPFTGNDRRAGAPSVVDSVVAAGCGFRLPLLALLRCCRFEHLDNGLEVGCVHKTFLARNAIPPVVLLIVSPGARSCPD